MSISGYDVLPEERRSLEGLRAAFDRRFFKKGRFNEQQQWEVERLFLAAIAVSPCAQKYFDGQSPRFYWVSCPESVLHDRTENPPEACFNEELKAVNRRIDILDSQHRGGISEARVLNALRHSPGTRRPFSLAMSVTHIWRNFTMRRSPALFQSSHGMTYRMPIDLDVRPWFYLLNADRPLLHSATDKDAAWRNLRGTTLVLGPIVELLSHGLNWTIKENTIVISHPPERFEFNEDWALHSEDGPALAYAGGLVLSWAINGVQVDEQIVLRPETQTLAQIRAEQNAEVKRVRIERYGWAKYLKESDAKVLDVAVHPQWMESLMEVDRASNFVIATKIGVGSFRPVDEGYKVLVTVDPSTGRVYALEVDGDCLTCADAQRYLLAPKIAFGRSGVNIEAINTYPALRT